MAIETAQLDGKTVEVIDLGIPMYCWNGCNAGEPVAALLIIDESIDGSICPECGGTGLYEDREQLREDMEVMASDRA